MIRNLKDTTLKNAEQDWLKTNLAKFTRMLQGQRDLLTVARLILSELAPVVTAQHGVFYIMAPGDSPALELLASYAHCERKHVANVFKLGEGLVGQAALEKQKIVLGSVPSDYVQISSGLGAAPPLNIIVLPVLFEGEVKAVIELASFERFSPTHHQFLDLLVESIGIVLNTIQANSRTEGLLEQSQSLAAELQSRQEELQRSNACARGEGRPARRAECRGRAEERGGGAGTPGAGGEGATARPDVEVQVRVPRQHVARAPDAAEQHADSRRAAGWQSGRPSGRRVRWSTH